MEKEKLDLLRKEVIIPDVVNKKTEDAFAKIQRMAEDHPPVLLSDIKTKKRFPRKRTALIIIAATLALATMSAAAAAYMKWSKSFSEGLRMSEEQQQKLAESNLNTFVEQSCTNAGITVTAVQSMTNEYYTYIAFRVEGYSVEDGVQPDFQNLSVTIDGMNDFFTFGSFYDGLICGDDGRPVHAEDGSPLELDADGRIINSYTMDDGSLEYEIYLKKTDEKGFFMNKAIHVEMQNLGTVAKADFTPEVEGTWTFDWNLEGSCETRVYEGTMALGDSKATVTRVEISPISMRAEYEFPKQETETTRYSEPPKLVGVKLKDGTLLPWISMGAETMGYVDDTSNTYICSFSTNRILDISQVDSVLFRKTEPDGTAVTEDDLYVVPME